MAMKRSVRLVLIVAVAVLLACAAVYAFILWEGSSARGQAPAIERLTAQWLLRHTVPGSARERENPLAAQPDPAELVAGQRLYRQKCELCHAYDGSGRTEIAAGQYPRPPDLRQPVVQTQGDGELFFHVANGIRHTGMPAWNLPERQVWQLVLYLRHLPHGAPLAARVDTVPTDLGAAGARFVGSAACQRCHAEIYQRWQKTRMANVVRDPRSHPQAVAPDLGKADPLLTFTREQIAFVYGSKWKQRYFTRIGDDFFPLPAQWDFAHRVWRPYFVKSGTDWWEKYYPPDNLKRPTGPLCDGCHSVNYDIATKAVTEWNVGCERCHGPGSLHLANPVRATIVNPGRLDYVDANDVCISCHSQGRPLTNPIAGKYYDWPVGFQIGKHLSEFWQLEEHRAGVESFTHYADGTAHKNRMQGNDFIQSLMYTRGVTCFSCHDVHGTPNDALLIAPGGKVCLNCHGPNAANGPHAPSIEAHTHHRAGSAGSDCIACHMPAIQQTIADVNVHAHTFRFITPAQTESLKVPNPCAGCHADKSSAWITATLHSWADRSPWRMAQ
jgi:predicted CXXCH cytochrome family protein